MPPRRPARPDAEFDELVDESDFVGLPMLVEKLGVKCGHNPTLGHMRRCLHEANDGTHVGSSQCGLRDKRISEAHRSRHVQRLNMSTTRKDISVHSTRSARSAG